MGAVTKALATLVEADEAAGATLIGMAVYDYLADQASNVSNELDLMYGAWALDRIGAAKRQLGRSYVEKTATGTYPDDSVQVAAEWLSGLEAYVVDAVAKSGEYEDWATRVVFRDARGRFSRDLSGAGAPSVKFRQAAAPDRLAPGVKFLMGDFDGMDRDQQERLSVYQGQYERAGDLLYQMSRSFRGEDRKGVEGVITVQNSDGRIDEIVFPLSDMTSPTLPKRVGAEWEVNENGLSVSIQAGRGASETTQRRVAAFNSLGVVGGTALQRLAEVEPQRWQGLAGTLEMPANEPDSSKLTRFFNQLSAGGRVLQQITGQERLGEWAQFVGSMGPQAEQVLGPYVQRAAYRYRGTERTPDPRIVGELRNSPRLTGRLRALSETGLTGDSLVMQARADVAAWNLAKTLPKDPIFRRLSEASGNVLPSQGILIDADGDVVSQAVGYADDHYLPFDLKGLSRLRGGQYIRTRMSGGPTAEDIYAAVHTGARMLTVVSPSGVYTLEFDPSFRGARAGSDKARQMNDRYIKILDAVKGSGLYLQDIDPLTRNKIEDDLRRQFPGDDDTSNENRNAAREKRLNVERLKNMNITPEGLRELEVEARSELGLGADEPMRPSVARQYEDVLSNKIDGRRSKMVNQLRLNGEGYSIALTTLQQQFPYFLKVPRFTNFTDFASNMSGDSKERSLAPPAARFTTDTGYVGPGALRPKSVGTGFYDFQGTKMPTKRAMLDRRRGVPQERPGIEAAAPGGSAPSPVAPGGAPSPVKGQDAAAASNAAGKAPDSDVPTGGIWDRLRKASALLTKRRDSDVAELYRGIGGVPQRDRRADEVAELTLEEVAGDGPGDDMNLAKWFLTRSAKEMLTALNSGSPVVESRLLPVLQNQAIMEAAFNEVLVTDRSGSDWFESGGTVAGINNMGQALQWIAAKSTDIADLTYMRDPFVSTRTGSEQAYYTGGRPQGFDDITAISTEEEFTAFASENAALRSLSRRLLESDTGDVRSLGSVAAAANKRVEALRTARDLLPKLAGGEPNPFESSGVDEDQLAADLMIDDDVDVADYLTQTDLDEEALLTQRAWTFYTVGRGLELLGRAGGSGPKGAAPEWSPVSSLRKSQTLTDPRSLARAVGRPLLVPSYVLKT